MFKLQKRLDMCGVNSSTCPVTCQDKIQTLWGNMLSFMCYVGARGMHRSSGHTVTSYKLNLYYLEIIKAKPACQLSVVYFIQLNKAEIHQLCNNKYDPLN